MALVCLMGLGVFMAIIKDPGFLLALFGPVLLLVGLAFGVRWLLNSGKRIRLRALKLADVDRMTGREFEHYVGALLTHQGYETTVTRSSGDLGGDVIAAKGNLRYVVQTKRYSNGVDRTAVSDAVAAMAHYKCNACMVVTSNWFTAGAKQLAHANGCVLVDRDTLAEWILGFQGAQQPGDDPAAPAQPPIQPSPARANAPAQNRPPLTQAQPTSGQYLKVCPRCQQATALDTRQCAGCAHLFRTQFAAPT